METAVEIRKREQAKSAWQLLEKMKPSIAAVLPKHLGPERMAMIAFTAMRKTPKLLECSPESIAGSIMTAAMLGLEPSGPIGHGALIPYWNSRRQGGAGYECQFQPMYQGLLDLARRSGFIKDVQLRAVYEGDTFSYRFGLDPDIQHVPKQGDVDPNRKPTNVYAIIRLTSGGIQWDTLSWSEAIAWGKRYSPSWDAQKQEFKPGSVWADNPLAMCLKTILKIVLKLCPKSPELAAAIQMDDLADIGKTSTMRKMADDVFDVDFGDEPEDERRPGKALDAIVEKEKAKKDSTATPAPGHEEVQPAASQPQASSAVEDKPPFVETATQQDIELLEILGTEYGVGMKKWKKHIETFGVTWEMLPKELLPQIEEWIKANGKLKE